MMSFVRIAFLGREGEVWSFNKWANESLALRLYEINTWVVCGLSVCFVFVLQEFAKYEYIVVKGDIVMVEKLRGPLRLRGGIVYASIK